MQYLISFLFIIEFLLLLLIIFYTLFKNGLNFKIGIAFALIYFIFIPIWIMIITGKLELSMSDFSDTKITNINLKDNIQSSFYLILFNFSIIIYLYFPSLKGPTLKSKILFIPSINIYLTIYLFCMLVIFIGSGLLSGGNWYDNRHNFFESYGSLALLIAFVLNSTKILIIASLTYNWLKENISFLKYLFLVVSFTVLDMVFSGNRIYLFCTAIMISLIYIKKRPKRVLSLSPILIPSVFVLGYFGSIFRHMRGPLFFKGLPTYEVFIYALLRAIQLEPPNPKLFFLGISESVNVNVIYQLFNSYDNFLFGTTFLKPLFFYLPRSIWQSKPESITIITAKTYGGASLVTTIIGEMYMNFYLLGIIILPIFLWIIDNVFTVTLRKYGLMSNLIMFIIGILIFRMPFSDELLVFVFLIIILVVSNNFRFIIRKNDF